MNVDIASFALGVAFMTALFFVALMVVKVEEDNHPDPKEKHPSTQTPKHHDE